MRGMLIFVSGDVLVLVSCLLSSGKVRFGHSLAVTTRHRITLRVKGMWDE